MTKDINIRGLYLACGYDKTIETEEQGIQLILRKFEDMTEVDLDYYVEMRDTDKIYHWMFEDSQYHGETHLKSALYLLSIGIDLFNAIEQGFAINQKELKDGKD